MDNLVKGAAGQAIQAFNVVFGLPETAGLEQRRSLPDASCPRPLGQPGALPSDLPAVEGAARLPRGFRAGAATAGVKKSGRPDLSVVLVDGGAGSVAATFTPNRFASAPVLLSRAHLATVDPGGAGRYATTAALLSVSGCANAATGRRGHGRPAATGRCPGRRDRASPRAHTSRSPRA